MDSASVASGRASTIFERLHDPRTYTGVYAERFRSGPGINIDADRRSGSPRRSGVDGLTWTKTDETVRDLSHITRDYLNKDASTSPTAQAALRNRQLLEEAEASGSLYGGVGGGVYPGDEVFSVGYGSAAGSGESALGPIDEEGSAGGGGHPVDTNTQLQLLFQYFCRWGRTGGSGEEFETIDSFNFAKFTRECPDLLTRVLSPTEVDLIFVKCKPKGTRRLNYGQFLDALSAMATVRYPEVDEPAAALSLLLHNHVFQCPASIGIAAALRAGILQVTTGSSASASASVGPSSPAASRGPGRGGVASGRFDDSASITGGYHAGGGPLPPFAAPQHGSYGGYHQHHHTPYSSAPPTRPASALPATLAFPAGGFPPGSPAYQPYHQYSATAAPPPSPALAGYAPSLASPAAHHLGATAIPTVPLTAPAAAAAGSVDAPAAAAAGGAAAAAAASVGPVVPHPTIPGVYIAPDGQAYLKVALPPVAAATHPPTPTGAAAGPSAGGSAAPSAAASPADAAAATAGASVGVGVPVAGPGAAAAAVGGAGYTPTPGENVYDVISRRNAEVQQQLLMAATAGGGFPAGGYGYPPAAAAAPVDAAAPASGAAYAYPAHHHAHYAPGYPVPGHAAGYPSHAAAGATFASGGVGAPGSPSSYTAAAPPTPYAPVVGHYPPPHHPHHHHHHHYAVAGAAPGGGGGARPATAPSGGAAGVSPARGRSLSPRSALPPASVVSLLAPGATVSVYSPAGSVVGGATARSRSPRSVRGGGSVRGVSPSGSGSLLGTADFKPTMAGSANKPGGVYARLASPESFTGVYRRAWLTDGRINHFADSISALPSAFEGHTNTRTNETIHDIKHTLRPNLKVGKTFR